MQCSSDYYYYDVHTTYRYCVSIDGWNYITCYRTAFGGSGRIIDQNNGTTTQLAKVCFALFSPHSSHSTTENLGQEESEAQAEKNVFIFGLSTQS